MTKFTSHVRTCLIALIPSMVSTIAQGQTPGAASNSYLHGPPDKELLSPA